VDDRVAALESKIEAIEELPQRMRALALMDTLREMRARTVFLESQVEDPQVKAKLEQLYTILGEIEAGIEP
jgi:predicted exporter